MLDRSLRSSAEQVFEYLYPDAAVRDECVRALAKSTAVAHAEAPERWGITLFTDVVRLTVGRIEVFACWADTIHCVFDAGNVPAALRRRRDIELQFDTPGVYPGVPISAFCNFPAEFTAELFPIIRSSLGSLIRAAGKSSLNPAARRAYSPGVTEFLASAVGLRPQHPSYYLEGEEAGPVAGPHFEGTARQVSLTIHERNPYARQACIKHYGCRCSVCGFDFEAVYGELGRGFMHVHHLTPVAEVSGERTVDPIAELRPICPNCHAMIHHDSETLSIEDLRERIASRGARRS